MKKTKSKYYLDNQEVNAPIEWTDIDVLATFDNDSIQANITTDKFTFVLKEYEKIKNWIESNRIFEVLPFKITAENDTNITVFDGGLNLAENLEIDNNRGAVNANLIKLDGLNSLNDRLQATTFGYLESIGIFNSNDYTSIDYVVQKKNNAFEILVSSIILYLMLKELYESIKNLSQAIADVSSKVAILPTGAVGAAIYSAAIAIITAAYVAAMVIAVINLANNLIKCFIHPRRQSKTIKLSVAMYKISNYFGYTFESNIQDLQSIVYLPSNTNYDEQDKFGFVSKAKGTDKGIPSVGDYGYSCADFFELVKKMFNGKFAVIDNRLLFYNEDDAFWKRNSNYILPDIQLIPTTYNTNELKANRLYSFETDVTDEYTISNFKGTNYEVITVPITDIPKKYNVISGLELVNFGVALGVRKNEKSGLDIFLEQLASYIDKCTSVLGTNSKYLQKIKTTVGVLVVGDNNWSKPKLLRVNGSRLSQFNLTAKYIYSTYYRNKSFVLNNYSGQKKIYKEIKIPFGLSDFVKLIENSYFRTKNGDVGKFTEIRWKIDGDFAIVSFWIQKKYTNNLKEIYVEPE